MGTSTRNSGQSGHNPLIPTWLEADPVFVEPWKGTTPSQQEIVPPDSQPNLQEPIQPIPDESDPNRFRGPRSSFSRFISSGGRSDSSMRRGIANYIGRSLGGSSNATKRIGAARKSTARIVGILSNFYEADRLQRIAAIFSLESLEGLSANEFFIKVSDFVCPDGGPEDEGISRTAYFDTLADNPDLMEKTTEELTADDISLILQCYVSKIVMNQIMNGIANNIIRFPDSLEEVSHIEDMVEQLVDQSVSDAFAQVRQTNSVITNRQAMEITDMVYQRTFEILERVGE